MRPNKSRWIGGFVVAAAAATVVALGVPTAFADSSDSPDRADPGPPAVSGEVGGELPDGFGPWAGDPVEFAIDASGDPDGTSGGFDVLHEHPNGDLVGDFSGDITCLAVGGNVAVATGVISEGKVHLPDEPVTDVSGQKVAFTFVDNGHGKDRMYWQWEFLGAPVNDCQSTAPVFEPDWGDLEVSGSMM